MTIPWLTKALPAGDETPLVQVNFTAAATPSVDNGRFAASPAQSAAYVVPANLITQAMLDNPRQTVFLNAKGPTSCLVKYIKLADLIEVLTSDADRGADDGSAELARLREENATLKDRISRAKAALEGMVAISL